MNKLIILSLCIGGFLTSSCDDFLSSNPESEISSSDFYKTPKDIENAVYGAYAALRANGMFEQSFYMVGEMRSDNTHMTWTPGNSIQLSGFYDFNLQTNNPFLESLWDDTYNAILRCNVVIENMGDADISQELSNQYLGEVRFLRALDYFYLVRVFGDVPLVTKQVSVGEAYNMGRTPVEQVYEQIIQDLEFARNNLPVSYSGSDVGRATKGAAMGLLAKVHLTRQQYAEAKTVLEEVMNLDVYGLLPEYEQLWDLSHENSNESLFEIQYKKGGTGTGSPFANNFAPRFSGTNVVSVGSQGSQNIPTSDMEEAYEDGDLRKDISMASGYTNEEGEFVSFRHITKYLDDPFAGGDADNNWPVLRYAEIMLMYAEVLNEINNGPTAKAYEMVNSIRKRAGLEALTTGMTYSEFFRAIEHERRVELAFENKRWFDLVRTNRALDVMNAKGYDIDEHQLLFPIPQGVIDTNPENIPQNPRY